jgi:ATP-dependent Clp protease ATP-binding subunit ClpX
VKSKIYLSKEVEKQLGTRFKKVLRKSGYKVSYKSLDQDITEISQILPDSSLKRIDATCNGLTSDDKNLSKCVKTLKRLLCLSQVDEEVTNKELGKSFSLLNKSFLYIQMSNFNKDWRSQFSSEEEMLKTYSYHAKFIQLHDALSKDVTAVEIVELFQKYSDSIYYKNNKNIPLDSDYNFIHALENYSQDFKEQGAYKLKYNQDEAFYVLFDIFPDIGLTDYEKKQFEELLSYSLSLNYKEKIRVIDALPRLSRFQVDELMKVWMEEEERFIKFDKEHPEDVVKLKKMCTEDWTRIKHKTLSDTLLSPQKLFLKLQDFVKGQNHVLKPLATILHYQQEIKYTQDETLKPLGPILLAGPTGSGKSFIVKTSSKLVDIPCIHVDASSLVGEGIKGMTTNDILKDVLRACDFDIKRSESAIVFLDEFDKLLLNHDGASIITQILRVIEGHKVTITKSFAESEEFKDISSLDTSRMLFIFGGSFEHIMQDKRQGHLGFFQQENASKSLSFEDLESSGFPRELLGRIKKIFMLNPLKEKDYLNILKTGKDSPIANYIELLKSTHGNKVSVEDGVLQAISKMASESDYGARGLHQIVHRLFEQVLFEAPESDEDYCIDMQRVDFLEQKIVRERAYNE